MPHTNKASAPVSVDIPEFEGRHVDLDGHTVGFEIYKADADPAEFIHGLPDDRCQCPQMESGACGARVEHAAAATLVRSSNPGGGVPTPTL